MDKMNNSVPDATGDDRDIDLDYGVTTGLGYYNVKVEPSGLDDITTRDWFKSVRVMEKPFSKDMFKETE